MGYPEYQNLEDPLLCYIYINGGEQYQVRASDIYQPLADYFSLTLQEQTQTRNEVHHDGRDEPLWNNRFSGQEEN